MFTKSVRSPAEKTPARTGKQGAEQIRTAVLHVRSDLEGLGRTDRVAPGCPSFPDKRGDVAGSVTPAEPGAA